MRLQPRQQTLEVWQALARFSHQDGQWNWDSRWGSNSISNAEQLLTLLYPATELGTFGLGLDIPDETADDVLDALRPLGNGIAIPKLLVDVLSDYMGMYTSASGTPIFAGGSYFQSRDTDTDLTDKQRDLGVVDSFSLAITLSLATLGFLKVFGRSVRRPALKDKLDALEAAASRRLSAAMVGLLRSFSVSFYEPDSPRGRALIGMINQGGESDKAIVSRLQRRLRAVRGSFRDATLGLSQDESLDNDKMLFECGWSWGIRQDAPTVDTSEPVGEQTAGVAEDRPYLYFTVNALDGILDLTSARTRVLGLLNAEQQRLAQALQLRWDLTKEYWSALARFGSGDRWPLEDIPWKTTDGQETEYYSLLMTTLVIMDFLSRRANDDDLSRVQAVLEELAIRGRINRRMVRDDAAIELHRGGVRFDLRGAEQLGPPMVWAVTDFSALLFKRAVRAASLSRNTVIRDRLLTVADAALDHMWRRRHTSGPATGLWDEPSVFYQDDAGKPDLPSWYQTQRVVEGLIMAAGAVDQNPIRSQELVEITTDLLSEADHLFGQEMIEAAETGGSVMHSSLKRIQANLERSRQLLNLRPATAHALVVLALAELDELTQARQDATRSI